MRFDVAGKVGSASQEAGVEKALRLKLGSNIGGAAEKPNFFSCANGNCAGFDCDAHRTIELMKCEREPILPGTDGDQVPRLIGGD